MHITRRVEDVISQIPLAQTLVLVFPSQFHKQVRVFFIF